jgi:hypothetical protein
VDAALDETIQYMDKAVRGVLNGGRIYILKGPKTDE